MTLFAIFIVAFLVRGVFISTLQDGYYFPDSEAYSEAAVNLITNGGLGERYNRPPGYPVFLAGIYVLFGESIFAVRIVESIVGALLAMVIAVIGRRIGGDVVGALAGGLWSIYPLGVFIAGLIYPTNLLALLLASGLLCVLPDSQEKQLTSKRLLAAGLLLGLAALTIPVVLATIGAVGLWLIYWRRVERLTLVLLLFIGAALLILPRLVRDFQVHGRVVLIDPRVVEHLPRMRSADEELEKKKLKAIMQYPGEYAARIGNEFLHFWRILPDRVQMAKPGFRERWHEQHPRVVRNTIFTTNGLINAVSLLSTGPLFLFAILGTIAMWFRPERRGDLTLLWATIMSFAVTYSFFFTQTRYRIPVEPYIAILSAYGMKKTWDLIATRFAREKKVTVEGQVKV